MRLNKQIFEFTELVMQAMETKINGKQIGFAYRWVLGCFLLQALDLRFGETASSSGSNPSNVASVCGWFASTPAEAPSTRAVYNRMHRVTVATAMKLCIVNKVPLVRWSRARV